MRTTPSTGQKRLVLIRFNDVDWSSPEIRRRLVTSPAVANMLPRLRRISADSAGLPTTLDPSELLDAS